MNSKRKFFNVFLVLFVAFFVLMAGGCFNKDKSNQLSNDENPEIHAGDNNDNNNQSQDDKNDDQNQTNDNNDDNNDQNIKTTISIVGFGDSISAGYAVSGSDMYDAYISYDNDETDINSMCYTNLIANKLAESYETVNVKSYAKSGDTTADLMDKIEDKTTYPNLDSDVLNADIITLCIGANNVLGVALNYLPSYLSGEISKAEIEELFKQGVATFKNDYSNKIIPYLTSGEANVYVMTIYDPYLYFDVSEIQFTSSNHNVASFAQEFISTQFTELKNMAISYLNEINEYMLNQNIENVIVVDVNDSFDNLTKETHRTYINADSSKIQIDVDEIFDLNTFTIKNTSALQNNPYFDPHPTSLGQRYIANLFLDSMGIAVITLE